MLSSMLSLPNEDEEEEDDEPKKEEEKDNENSINANEASTQNRLENEM